MTDVLSQVMLGLQTLAMPFNLAALGAGTLSGALLGPVLRRLGIGAAAALVMLMPIASTLDPITGLVLLSACLTTALIATTDHAPATILHPRHHTVPLTAVVTGLFVIIAGASAAALVKSAAPADKLSLLVCGAAAAIVLAAITHPAGWLAAIALTVGGIAAQLSPLQPLDTEHASPMPLLFGLLIIGPAVLALVLPRRVTPWSTSFGGVELAATVLPALLLGIPATRGVSVFALNLGENGLFLGPNLLIQRPKLVLACILALIAAGILGMAGRMLADRMPRASWWPHIAPLTNTRASAAVTLLLAAAALYASEMDQTAALTLAVAGALSAVAAWFALELAPLVTGLVIGQFMLPPLLQLLTKSDAGPWASMTSGSLPLVVIAVLASIATLACPILQRRRLIP